MKTYTSKVVDDLCSRYAAKGGIITVLSDGILGAGNLVLSAPIGSNLANFVIKEIALNDWSTAHTIRKYNTLPAKYARLIEA